MLWWAGGGACRWKCAPGARVQVGALRWDTRRGLGGCEEPRGGDTVLQEVTPGSQQRPCPEWLQTWP